MAFSFLRRNSPGENLRNLKLSTYSPGLTLEGLMAGIDNVRHDVFLSPKFTELTRHCIFRLLVQYGNVGELVAQQSDSAFRPASIPRQEPPKSRVSDPAEFKRQMSELLAAAVNRAKAENNISLDLLARTAVIKFLRSEMVAQFATLLERCRVSLKVYENPRSLNPEKAMRVREAFMQLQVGKKVVLRKAGQDLLQTCREVEKETLARLRRSLFGDAVAGGYDLFLNRLIFTEDGNDDGIKAEHYVLLGNFAKDPDRYDLVLEICRKFLRSLGASDDTAVLDAALSAPENAQELVSGDDSGRAQNPVLSSWMKLLEDARIMRHVLAAYEIVPLLAQFSPPINAQQLKNALLARDELIRVEGLLEEQGKLDSDALRSAVRRVALCRGDERARVAARFLRDFMIYHRDLRRLQALTSAMDCVNLAFNEKMRDLSAMNNTLYEFLLPEEQKPAEERVVRHVVLKADIRGSTMLTRTLMERGLNPASHFTLNFYDPVNKLLPIFGAKKVFIEGDALILAMLEHEGEPELAVARACVLSREILNIVSAYNDNSERAGLPVLELGIGICYEDSAPLYLMDGADPIMISQALNQSDRLSACNRLARRIVGENRTSFRVYACQTTSEPDADADEFVVRYNLGGIHLSGKAFQKLQQEISLRVVDTDFPTIWKSEVPHLYAGVVPMPSGGLQTIVVREARVAIVDPRDLTFKAWSDRRYYEVCTAPAVYAVVEREPNAALAMR